jgi:hypothetical protein
MRAPLVSALLLALACSDRITAEPAPVREKPLAQDGTATRAYTSTPDRAKVQLDLAAVRAALQMHKVDRGAWPASVADLGVDGLHYPKDLVYDAASGTVKSETYPGY